MLKIYGAPISVHTRKVIVVARLKGLAFEVVPAVPVLPASLPPHWHALSPTGLIPVVEDGDFTLADSSAICAYLDSMHPQPPVYPVAPRERARALWFEQYAGDVLFRRVVQPLFQETVVHAKMRQQPVDERRIEAVSTRTLPQVLAYLDTACGQAFLAGPDLSVADIAVTSNLVTMQYLGFALDPDRFARLAALVDRTLRQPAMADALRAEQPAAQQMGLDGSFLTPVLA